MTNDQRLTRRGYTVRVNVNAGQIVSYSALKQGKEVVSATSKTKLVKLVRA